MCRPDRFGWEARRTTMRSQPHPNEHLDYDYWISRYPVTNGQFAEFVKAGGYAERRYWLRRARPAYGRMGVDLPVVVSRRAAVQGRASDTPEDYGEPFNLPNHRASGDVVRGVLSCVGWEKRGRTACPTVGRFACPRRRNGEGSARGETIPEVPLRSSLPLPSVEMNWRTNPAAQARLPLGGQDRCRACQLP